MSRSASRCVDRRKCLATSGKLSLLRLRFTGGEAFSRVQATTTRPKSGTTTDGAGVASHVGCRLLADPGHAGHGACTTPPVPAPTRRSASCGLAVAVADGATTISDIAVLADHSELFGAVASDCTCWRLLDNSTPSSLR